MIFYFYKEDTAETIIDWGDGSTSTSTTAGANSIQHTYANTGSYIIAVESAGRWGPGRGTSSNCLFGSGNYLTCLRRFYCGSNVTIRTAYAFYGCNSLQVVTRATDMIFISPTKYSFSCVSVPLQYNIPNNVPLSDIPECQYYQCFADSQSGSSIYSAYAGIYDTHLYIRYNNAMLGNIRITFL